MLSKRKRNELNKMNCNKTIEEVSRPRFSEILEDSSYYYY